MENEVDRLDEEMDELAGLLEFRDHGEVGKRQQNIPTGPNAHVELKVDTDTTLYYIVETSISCYYYCLDIFLGL